MLSAVLTAELFATMMVFARIGSAFIVLPTIGETFLSPRVRLAFAVAVTLVTAPVIAPLLPSPPSSMSGMLGLIGIEILVGLFIGGIARLMVAALSVAGTIVGFQSGLASALLFNPLFSDQGALHSVFFALLGTLLFFTTDMHHLLIRTTVESYFLFEPGLMPIVGDMADMAARVMADAFSLGLRIAAPVMVFALMLFVLSGLLARLMPQMQVFFVVMPLQVLLGTFVLMVSISGMMMVYLEEYRELVAQFLVQ